MIPTSGFLERRHGRRSSSFIADDPRFLMLAFGLIILAALVIGGTIGLVPVLLYVFFLYRCAGVPVGRVAKYVKTITPFIALILVVNALLVHGDPFLARVPFLSRDGVVQGIHYGVRLLVLYLSVTLFLTVASPEAIASGTAAMLRPISRTFARRAALHSFLAIGYLPLFAREIERIRVAQRFRGGGLDGGPLKRINGVRLLLVPLILSAVQRSAHLAMVVELRDIETTIGPLLVLDPLSRKDYVFVGITLGILLLSLAAS